MTAFARTSVATSLALLLAVAQAADGATAPYNEAVRIVAGRRVVELPPPLGAYPAVKPPPIGPHAKPQYLIEHERGLMQCTSSMYHEPSCERSDYGRVKQRRTWVVKRGGVWQGCVGVPAPTECRDLVRKLKPGQHFILAVLPGEVF